MTEATSIIRVGFAIVALFATAATGVAAESEAQSAPPVDAKRILDLITQLGADDYFARERAQSALTELGAEAFDALTEAAETSRDVEITERIAYLLRTIHIDWVRKSEPPEVLKLLQNYDGMTEHHRRTTIGELAALPGTIGLPALCRIVRFEASHPLSKHAALAIISQTPESDEEWQARAEALQTNLGSGKRPAAQWIRAYLEERDDPVAGAAKFAELIDAEERLLRQFPYRSAPEIVMNLLRRQADAYKRLERPDEMVAALIRMVAYVQDDSTQLNDVLKTLTERQDWDALEQVVKRFEDRILQDPLTSYYAARAYQVKGDKTAAGRYVKHALEMRPGDQRGHIMQAFALRGLGWIEWAEQEYRASAKMGDPSDTLTLIAQFQLGESLHDRGKDQEAAKVLEEASQGIEKGLAKGNTDESGRSLAANRARAHYFNALHFKEQNNSEKALQHLLEGLGEDQHDAEILIELFHVPELDVTVRDRVRKLIREAAEIERKRIEANPDDDTPYNQLAWLISNTEGDFNEALEASKRSLELKPESAGHLDTLGRCYYALGDYENAVKNQRRAIELDPHSQQMRRQLKLFESALEKKQAAEKK